MLDQFILVCSIFNLFDCDSSFGLFKKNTSLNRFISVGLFFRTFYSSFISILYLLDRQSLLFFFFFFWLIYTICFSKRWPHRTSRCIQLIAKISTVLFGLLSVLLNVLNLFWYHLDHKLRNSKLFWGNTSWCRSYLLFKIY